MSGLNAKAKPFVFNPNAGSFTPVGPSSSAPAASSPPPGFAAPRQSASPPPPSTVPVDTFESHTGDARPLTQPSDSWEELAEDSKAQSIRSAPVDGIESLAAAAATNNVNHSSSPAPTTAGENVSSSATFPDASVTALPNATLSAVDDVTEKVDGLALDEEEAKELAEAADLEALETVRKPKKDDSERKAHDEREHINIVFIGHVDAGKYDTRNRQARPRSLRPAAKRWLC